MVQDNSAYYLLGYTTTAAPRDGKFHEIQVRVKRRDVDVRARKGYWAYTAEDAERASAPSKPAAPRDVVAALDDLAGVVEPTGRSPVVLWLGATRGPDADGKAVVTFAWEPSPGTPDPGEVVDRVNVTVNSIHGDLLFKGPVAKDPQAPRPGGTVTFQAPPGEVRARVIAENAKGMRLETAEATILVPDFSTPGPTITTPFVFRGRTARDLQVVRAATAPGAVRVTSVLAHGARARPVRRVRTRRHGAHHHDAASQQERRFDGVTAAPGPGRVAEHLSGRVRARAVAAR